MSSPFNADLLSRLSDWATAQFGLRFPPDRWHELGRGVASAALELGIPDLEGWAGALVDTLPPPDQARAIANHLTISETYFFRHPENFRLLEQDILPARIARRREQSRSLRIWSAGCASGEEPYSVAMLLAQRFTELGPERSSVFGTDINSQVLARAEAGVYSDWSFRDTPAWVKATYFQRKPNGRFQISPEIRRRVKFMQVNFAAPFYPAEFGERGDFDVILCRNVLMYFSAEWQERIISRLFQALAPGGWLLTGPIDITNDLPSQLGLVNHGPGIFEKPAVAGVEPARTISPAPILLDLAPEPLSLPPIVAPVSPPVAVATTGEVASARAQSHADRGELDEALAACEQAIAADKTNPGYHYLHGCILQEKGRPTEAAESFRRVLFLEPNAVMAQFALGCLADRLGRGDEARRHFAAVLRILAQRNRGEMITGGEGLTVGRLRAVIENNLTGDAA